MARKDGKDRGLFERPAGSGVWWIRFVDQHGKERRERWGPKSLAREKYAERKTEVRKGTYVPRDELRAREKANAEQTVRHVVERYLEASRLKTRQGKLRSEHSLKTDDWHGRLLIEAFGDQLVDDLSPHDVEMWMARRAQHTSPSTANRHLGFLKRVCRKAIRDRLATRDVTMRVDPLGEKEGSDRYLKPDEEPALKAAMEELDWTIVEVAMHTGFRRENVFSLRWEDIDFDMKRIRLPYTKAGKRQYLPMNSRLEEVLLAQRARAGDSEWVFPNTVGGHLDPRHWWRRKMKPALEKAGITDFRFHDLRHTFGSYLTMNGVPLRAVQKLMGHSSSRVTERYSHLADGYLAEAVESMVAGGARKGLKGPNGSAPESAPNKNDPSTSPESPSA